jgi:hypothetical protein
MKDLILAVRTHHQDIDSILILVNRTSASETASILHHWLPVKSETSFWVKKLRRLLSNVKKWQSSRKATRHKDKSQLCKRKPLHLHALWILTSFRQTNNKCARGYDTDYHEYVFKY